ncbi:uncharacterized protein VTP21DRAFT_574 [Calcarisporiella thermophila]|uniref:uncharacterized protein n=1 Tax=Calcarisporiella thermophila TaxID=911321 RepID=UPI003742E32A
MTLKARPCGNPLLLQWIGEWVEDYKAAGNKAYHTYRKAYDSMQSYPIPFQHPAEAIQLSYIGPGIVKRLEKKMEEYCRENNLPMPQLPEATSFQKRSNGHTSNTVLIRTNSADQEIQSENQPKKRKARMYVPVYRSGAYAILISLLKHHNLNPGVLIGKRDIIQDARPHCDSSFDVPGKGGYFKAWSSMKTLLEKEYVYKSGTRFMLTDVGIEVARQLAKAAQAKQLHAVESSSLDENAAQLPDIENEDPGRVIIEDYPDSSNTLDRSSTTLLNDLSAINADYPSGHSSLSSSLIRSHSLPINSSGSKLPSISRTSSSIPAENLDSLSSFDPIVFSPNTFEIILLLDTREIRMKKDRDYIADKLEEEGVAVEVRNLELGDVIWVAKEKATGKELVLDYVVERKRMDDLVQSIKDGRFKEQKFRLSQSGASQIIYLIEDYNVDEARQFGMQAIMSAISSTQVVDEFFVKRTATIDESIKYLAYLTHSIKKMHLDSQLFGIPSSVIERATFLALKRQLAIKYPSRIYLVPYVAYSELNSKYRTLCLGDLFVKMLKTIRGVSTDRAAEIVRRYETPRSLFDAYVRVEEGEEALMISRVCNSVVTRKRVGPTLSEKIHKIWRSERY